MTGANEEVEMRQTQARQMGRRLLRDAVTKEQATQAMVYIACAQIGRDICSPLGRQRLIDAAINRITQDIAYTVTAVGRLSSYGMLAILRQYEVILF